MNDDALRLTCLPVLQEETSPASKLLNLPDEQKLQICDWLEAGKTPGEIARLGAEELGLEFDPQALAAFRRKIFLPFKMAWRAGSAKFAQEVLMAAEEDPELFEKAALENVKQKVFEMTLSRGSSPKDIAALLSLALNAKAKAKSSGRADQKLRLDKRKVELAFRKHKEQVAARKEAIQRALKESQSDGAITKEAFERVEEMLNLL